MRKCFLSCCGCTVRVPGRGTVFLSQWIWPNEKCIEQNTVLYFVLFAPSEKNISPSSPGLAYLVDYKCFIDGGVLCNQQYFWGVIWQFNDEVLWFVRTIIILYAVFFLYILLFSHIPKWGNVLLMLFMTATATFGVKYWGLGDPISVPLFFVGMAVAQWPEQVKHLLRSWISVLLFLIIVGVAILGRFDNRILHGVINYAAILCLLILCAFYNIHVNTLPKWLGECSYDLYLTHNKIHLLIIRLFAIDRLWMFVVGASVAAFMFYNLRRLFHLI